MNHTVLKFVTFLVSTVNRLLLTLKFELQQKKESFRELGIERKSFA